MILIMIIIFKGEAMTLKQFFQLVKDPHATNAEYIRGPISSDRKGHLQAESPKQESNNRVMLTLLGIGMSYICMMECVSSK